MREYVLVFAECNREEILVILKNKPEWMAGRLNLLGGKIDPEDKLLSSEPWRYALVAAERELKEESGYKTYGMSHMGEISDANESFKIHVVKAFIDNPTDEIEQGPGETEAVSWILWKHLRYDPRLMPNLRVIIPLIQSGITGWKITVCDNLQAVTHKMTIELPV